MASKLAAIKLSIRYAFFRKFSEANFGVGDLEMLNAMLDAEADEIAGAKRYARSEKRRDYHSGSYKRKLTTRAGEVELKVPKLRSLPFETSIIECYRRRESSVEEALTKMVLADRRTK